MVRTLTLLVLVAAGCAGVKDAARPSGAGLPRSQPRADLAITQVEQGPKDVATEQLSGVVNATTAQQLDAYADLCAPGRTPPRDVDCSELRLRIQRGTRDDDELARALAVLDRLERPEPGGADELVRSASAGRIGVAPDLLAPQSVKAPPEPTLEDLGLEILGTEGGIVVVPTEP